MNRHILTGLTAVVSAAVGAAAGYYISRRQLEAAYEERLTEELAKTAAHMNNSLKSDILKRVPGATLDPSVVEEDDESAKLRPPAMSMFDNSSATLERVVKGLRYGPDAPIGDPKPAPRQPIQRNAFDDEEDEDEAAAWAEEISQRSPKKPYIIDVTEFGEEDGYSKVTLTYFMMDDTLIDEGEVPIEDAERVVGESNLDRFGYRSGDPRIIYIRNEKLKADYEVLLHDGSFGEAVHGVVTPRTKQRPGKMPRER